MSNTGERPIAVGDSAPDDRFCDLVMKGGVTSGIIYPPLIASLSKLYRFKNIGGSSAGAIAAAVTAAAEYGRRAYNTTEGFERLNQLPHELKKVDGNGHTRLFRLFQPDPACARLFSILSSSLNRARARSAVLYGLLAVVAAYAWAVSVAALASAGLLVALGSSPAAWIAAALLALIVLLVILVFAVYFDLTHGLVRNGYGLCSGLTIPGSRDAALTPWLHELIQTAAHRSVDAAPVTFGELWTAPGAPVGTDQLKLDQRRSIDLRLFTTNLTHGRPYLLPNDRASERIFARAADLQRVLPAPVVEWMVLQALPITLPEAGASEAALVQQAKDLALFELTPENFPILLAARLSLSFPVLLCTVHLWVINRDGPGPMHFSPCVFSDGGLCANFPIHLFDTVLPAWPTFGIQLEPLGPFADRVYLPSTYRDGVGNELWQGFDREFDPSLQLFGFFSAMIDAMQNWNDNSLARLPGVRDRVVHVRLADGEGGLNLNMAPSLINKVSQLGTQAAVALEQSFIAGDGWNAQRNVRLSVLVKTLEDRLRDLRRVAVAGPHAVSYEKLFEEAQRIAPPGFDQPLRQSQVEAIEAILDALERLADVLTTVGPSYGFEAVPQTELRIRPTI